MEQLYAANTADLPPSPPSPGATGYPQGGGVGSDPTQPGAHWFDMVTRTLLDPITEAGIPPSASDMTQLTQAIRALATAAAGAAIPTGFVGYHRRHAAPPGWVELRDGTVGNASSGATVRANDDTAALFALIWMESDNTAAPIQDSAGVASIRGASAAVDFAAGKRLPLDDMRAEFIRGLDNGRGVDVGRTLGSYAPDSIKSHRHAVPVWDTAYPTFDDAVSDVTQTAGMAPDDGSYANNGMAYPSGAGSAQGGAETAPRSRAYLACIKL